MYVNSPESFARNERLLAAAAAVLKPVQVRDRVFGNVGAAVLTAAGGLFTGVAVDTPGWGLCAERSAVAAMITAGQYRIAAVAAVWRDERSGRLHVLPPCGGCREFLRAVDEGNLEAEVVLGPTRSVPLKELLPLHAWPAALDEESGGQHG